MRNLITLLAIGIAFGDAQAGFTQVTIEAESQQAIAGTYLSDVRAGEGAAVMRTSDGPYAWWERGTADLTAGWYSLYVRAARAPNSQGTRSFIPEVYLNEAVLLGAGATTPDAEVYDWRRVVSFNLQDIGESDSIRVGDYSHAGLLIDKLALVKDVYSPAEASGVKVGDLATDPGATGGATDNAVTRETSGIYAWWTVTTSDLVPGDYDVYARIRSGNGQPHDFVSFAQLDSITPTPRITSISSQEYSWTKVNEFVFSGSGQSVEIADYSDAGMYLDAIRLVRRTPNDQHTMAQRLFAAGNPALGSPQEVGFALPSPNDPDYVANFQMTEPGRVAVVPLGGASLLAYFRQSLPNQRFQIHVATSSDGGATFRVNPSPIIAPGGGLIMAYDPQVAPSPAGGYEMVFEGESSSCLFSAFSATSSDGIAWTAGSSAVVCGYFPFVDGPDPDPDLDQVTGSISVPAHFRDVRTGASYLQFVSIDDTAALTRRYQVSLPYGLATQNQYFDDKSEISGYSLPPGQTGSWDERNFGAGNVFYEDGFYYLVYEGADHYNCEGGTWGLGIARASDPSVLSGWIRSPKAAGQIIAAAQSGNCWISYPQLVAQPGGTYLYYYDPLTNWANPMPSPSRSFFRRIIAP